MNYSSDVAKSIIQVPFLLSYLGQIAVSEVSINKLPTKETLKLPAEHVTLLH